MRQRLVREDRPSYRSGHFRKGRTSGADGVAQRFGQAPIGRLEFPASLADAQLRMGEVLIAWLTMHWRLIALASAGVAAGTINTIAGGGGFLTLPILLSLGLPANMANATMRVGIVLQNLASIGEFARHGLNNARLSAIVLVPMLIGALIGVELAVRLPSAILQPLFGAALLVWGLVLLLRPGRFLHPPAQPRPFGPLAFALAVLVGIYGGFMQAGVGFPILALMVLYLGHDAVRSNAVKVAVVFVYTAVILPRFATSGLISWKEGIILGAGMMLGGWLGARWQVRAGAGLIRWFVLVMVVLSGAMMLAQAF